MVYNHVFNGSDPIPSWGYFLTMRLLGVMRKISVFFWYQNLTKFEKIWSNGIGPGSINRAPKELFNLCSKTGSLYNRGWKIENTKTVQYDRFIWYNLAEFEWKNGSKRVKDLLSYPFNKISIFSVISIKHKQAQFKLKWQINIIFSTPIMIRSIL